MIRALPLFFLFALAAEANIITGSFLCNTPQDSGGSTATGATITAVEGCSFGSSSAGPGLILEDTSTLNMTGGQINASGDGIGLEAIGSGGADSIMLAVDNMSAGTDVAINGQYGSPGDAGVVISAGVYYGTTNAVDIYGLGTGTVVEITGGQFYTLAGAVVDSLAGELDIADGYFLAYDDGSDQATVTAQQQGTINVTGGTFLASSAVPIFSAQDSSVINIYGTGLAFSDGDIVGTLQDGETIDDAYQTVGSGQINLINQSSSVPEPASLTLLGCGLLALGLVRWFGGAARGLLRPKSGSVCAQGGLHRYNG